MKKMLQKPLAILLTVTMATVMTSPVGVFAADRDPVIDAAKQAGVDVKNKDEVEAFSNALEEAGIDIADIDADYSDEDKGVPAVTREKGIAPEVDKVPAVGSENTKHKKNNAGFSAHGMEFSDLTDEIRDNCANINVGENVDNSYVTQVSGEIITYRFTAQQSGMVSYWSTGSVDTCGRVLYSEGQEIIKDDDSDDGKNFRVYFKITEGATYYLQVRAYGSGIGQELNVHLKYEDFSVDMDVQLNKSTGQATVMGTVDGDTFEGLYVDGNKTDNEVYGLSTFDNAVINMKNYDVGFHTISVKLKDHAATIPYEYAVPTYIYGAPSIKLSDFTTGKNYLVYYNSGNYYSGDSDCDVFFDYKKKGGKWDNNYGPIERYYSGKKSKLKANTWYYARIHYGKVVTYNGKTYLFTGKETGKLSKALKMKTGKAKKPKVKKIKITKAKQFKRTYTSWVYIYGGYGYPVTYTQWYTKFKVTVVMKKKPGTAGIYIGNKRLKGNKKKYTANFTVTGKQKGKKLKVAVYSYQNATYGGYSPVLYKKVKVKK